MKKTSLFKSIIMAVSFILLVLIAFSAVLLNIVSKGVYVQQKADELLPQAEMTADEIVGAIENNLDYSKFNRILFVKGLAVYGSKIYALDVKGNGLTNVNQIQAFDEGQNLVEKYFDKVIAGERVSLSSTEMGVLVGVPAINASGRIVGAAFIITPVAEIKDTMNKQTIDLLLVCLISAVALIVPVYFFVKKITNPVKDTAEIALKMAEGDLSVRANENGTSETIRLARSFNTLADNLQKTIDNLTVEKHRLKTVIDGIGEGIISTNNDGVIELYNSIAVELLGGKKDDKIASLDNYSIVVKCILSSLETSQTSYENIIVGEKIIRCSASLLNDGNENCGVVVLLRDITESERLERTRKEYVANVSHELRTPLASIRSLADALADGMVTTDADKMRYYGYIQRETIRLSRLVNDLLELSRLQSGAVAVSMMNVDLYETLFSVVDRLAKPAEERGKHVWLDIGEDEYISFTNEDRVEQVLVVLIDNAIKHGDENTDVHVNMSFDSDDNRYTITVSNNASDMNPDDLSHIFDRFFKTDRAHTGEGTGIGLSIASEVLSLMGEKIWADYADGMIYLNFTVKGMKLDEEISDDI